MPATLSDLAALLLVLAAVVVPAVAGAGELKVYSGGAVKSGLTAVTPQFEQAGGHKVEITFEPMGGLVRKLAAGDVPDVVVLTKEVMAEAVAKGWVVAASVVEAGRVGVGVAVNEKAAAPDISTPEAFKAALLAAKSIVYIDPTRGTSGKHVAEVLDRLGIAEAMKPRTTLLSGGYVVEPVGRGEIELGLHQITEILPVKGIKLVGPLPAALQKVSVYEAALTTRARDAAAGKAYLAHLRAPAVRAAFARLGFMPD